MGDGESKIQNLKSKIFHLNRYALVKGQAKEYVRESQVRLLLQPVADAITRQWGKASAAIRLQQLLHSLRNEAPLAPGYAAANILHLLLHLQVDVRGYDFSRLSVWQADLRGVSLPGVDFSHADLTNSLFTESMGFVLALAFNPGGKWLAAGCQDGQISLWHTANQQVRQVLRGDRPVGRSLAFSPDGQLLAGGGFRGTLSLWHLNETSEQYEPAHVLQIDEDEVTAIAFSPHPGPPYLLASASWNRTVQVWEITPAEALATAPELHIQRRHLLPHPQRVAAVAFSPDGQLLATGGVDHVVRLWDVGSPVGAGQLCQTWPGHTGAVNALAFSPAPTGGSPQGARLLASASADGTVRLWEVATGQVLHVLDQHEWIVSAVAFSPNGKRVVTGSHDQMVRIWDADTGQLLCTLAGHTYIIRGVAFSPDGKTVASASADHTVRLWDAQTCQPLYTLRGHPRALRALAFSSRQTLASAGHDHLVHLWQVDGVALPQSHRSLHGHTNRLHALAFSPDGCLLASAGADQTIRLWAGGVPSGPGQLWATLHGHTDVIYTLAFSPDNQLLASGGRDRMIQLYDVPTGQVQATLCGHTSEINGVAFHPAGGLLASTSADQTLRLWDLASPGAPEIASARVNLCDYGDLDGTAVAFSPDGAILACSSTLLIFVWELAGGGELQLRHRLKAHTNWITTLAFSPAPTGHPQLLASGGHDLTICLWDVHSGQLLYRIQEQDGRVPTALVFSADGAHLFSTNYEGTITCWEVASGRCLQTLCVEDPYAGMNITGVTGLTEAQKAALMALGAEQLLTSA